jgi:hypothetical protein
VHFGLPYRSGQLADFLLPINQPRSCWVMWPVLQSDGTCIHLIWNWPWVNYGTYNVCILYLWYLVMVAYIYNTLAILIELASHPNCYLVDSAWPPKSILTYLTISTKTAAVLCNIYIDFTFWSRRSRMSVIASVHKPHWYFPSFVGEVVRILLIG